MLLSERCFATAAVTVGLLVSCQGIFGCGSRGNILPIAQHTQVQPSLTRDKLLVLEAEKLHSIDLKGQSETLASYSEPLAWELPLRFVPGKVRMYLACGSSVYDVSSSRPEVVVKQFNAWADSPIAVVGHQDSLAYVSSSGSVVAGEETIGVHSAEGIYSSPHSNYLYIANEESFLAYDSAKDAVVGRIAMGGPKKLSIADGGKNVLLTHGLNKLAVYDQKLSTLRYGLGFKNGATIWATDLHKEQLAVVTWEGSTLSAKWVVHCYDGKTQREVRSLTYNEPIECFVMEKGIIAIVGERWISLQKFGS